MSYYQIKELEVKVLLSIFAIIKHTCISTLFLRKVFLKELRASYAQKNFDTCLANLSYFL